MSSWKNCSGCNRCVAQGDKLHVCTFAESGFTLNGSVFPPCGVRYHSGCIRVGEPFTTRLSDGKGLSYPSDLWGMPFICERCTVQANLGRFLQCDNSQDIGLLCLERMRMIDLAHYWAKQTMSKNMRSVRQFSAFLSSFGLPPLLAGNIPHPPVDLSISLGWCMLHKSIQHNPRARHNNRVGFNSLRVLRSGAAAFMAFSCAVLRPSHILRENKRLYGHSFLSFTENVSSQFFNKGMSVRLGTAVIPSKVLFAKHIHWNQTYRLQRLQSGGLSLVEEYILVAAQVAELCGWLGWLRSMECFSLCRGDFRLIRPEHSLREGLPAHTGAVQLSLLPETKSSRSSTADVVIAWCTGSGLQFGNWVTLLFRKMDGLGWTHADSRLFRDPRSHAPWTSRYYRHELLFPLLRLQRDEGDPYLQQFRDDTPGQGFADKFTMFHLLRRGGRTHVTKKRPGCARKADRLEVYSHARWRIINRGKEAVDVHYVEPTLEDRLYLTLLCC